MLRAICDYSDDKYIMTKEIVRKPMLNCFVLLVGMINSDHLASQNNIFMIQLKIVNIMQKKASQAKVVIEVRSN